MEDRRGAAYDGVQSQMEVELRLERQRRLAAEASAAAAPKANAALQSTIDAIKDLDDLNQLVPRILEIVSEVFGDSSCAVFENDPSGTVMLRYWRLDGKTFLPHELIELDENVFAMIRLLANGFTVPDEYLGRDPRYLIGAVTLNHARGTAVPEFDRFAVGLGWDVELNIGVATNGIRSSTLCIYRKHEFTDSEIELGEALAKQLGLALETRRLAEAERKAAVAREREIATQQQVALLRRSNGALRKSVERVSQSGRFESLVEGLLLESIDIMEAAGGGITLWRDGQFGGHHCIAQDGAIVPREQWESEPFLRETAEVLSLDPGGFTSRLLHAPYTRESLEWAREFWPAAAEYHGSRGHVEVWNVPCTADGELLASLGLAFRQPRDGDPVLIGTLTALAQQIALVFQIARLAERAKAAAIAEGREQAAQAQAAELAKANAVLRRASESMVGATEASAILPILLQELAAATGAIDGVLYEYDDQAAALRFVTGFFEGKASPNLPGHPYGDADHPVRTADFPGWARLVEHGQPQFLRTELVEVAEAAVQWHRDRGHLSVLQSALMCAGNPIGLLGLAFHSDRELSPVQAELFNALAQQATLALQMWKLSSASRTQAVAMAVSQTQEKAARERAEALSRANASLEVSNRLLKVVAEISTRFAQNTDFTASLESALALIGTAAGLSRVLLYEERARPGESASTSHHVVVEWCAESTVTHAAVGLSVFPTEMASFFMPALRKGQSFWHRAEDLPPAFKEALGPLSIKLTGCAPIFVDGSYWGTVTFDDCLNDAPWDAAVVNALTVAANAIAAAIQMRKDDARLAAERERASREREEMIRERAAELRKANEALQRTTDALASAQGIEEILPSLLRILADSLSSLSAAYYEVEGLDTILLRYYLNEGNVLSGAELVAGSGAPPYDLPRKLAQGFLLSPDYIGAHARHSVSTRVIDHRQGTAVPEFDEWRRIHDREMELNIPLSSGSETFGALTISRSSDRPFTPDEIQLGETLSKQLSLALRACRLAADSASHAIGAAIAEEREQAAEQRVAELAKANEILRRSISKLVEVEDAEAGLIEAVRTAADIVEAPGGSLGVFVPEERGFRNLFQVVDGRIERASGLEYSTRLYSLDERPIQLAWERFHSPDSMIWCPRDSEYLTPDTKAYLDANGFHSAVLVPLKRGLECIGFLGFTSRREADLLPGQKELLRAVSDQIALMMELSRLAKASEEAAISREREQAAVNRAEAIARIAEAGRATLARLARQPDIEAFLGHVLEIAAAQFGAAAGGVWLARPGLTPKLALTFQGGHVRPAQDSDHPGVLGHDDRTPANFPAMLRGEIVVFDWDAIQTEPRLAASRDWLNQSGIRTLMLVPMFLGETYAGALSLRFTDDRRLNSDEIELAHSLANQAVLALEMRRLSDEAKNAAVAREREISAREQITELTRANGYLRKSLEASATLAGFESTLGEILKVIADLFESSEVKYWRYPEDGRASYVDLAYVDGRVCSRADDCTSLRDKGDLSREVSIPMNLAGRTIGAIVARTRSDFLVSPRNLELAFALTQQATLAVHLSDLAFQSESAAVLREQEKAAGEKIAELAKANRVLQRTAGKLTASAVPERFLSVFLGEAMDLAGASAGAIFRRVGETELTFTTMIQDGVEIPLSDIEALPCAPEKRQVSREDPAGYFARLMAGEVTNYQIDDPGDCCPPIALAYHREHGHRRIWEFPFSVDEKVEGTIALAFRTLEAPSELLIQTLTALTSQLAIALKLTRLNEEGQRVALALEREQTLAEERSRIAREIHDTLAQSFTGILMQLQAATEYFEMNAQVSAACVSRAEEMARDGLVQARTSVMSLSPKEPQLDLAERIRSTVERALTDTGTRSQVITLGQIQPLDAIVSANVLRICQEALNNAQRYSGATLILVTLNFEPHFFSMTVADDGAGFEVDAAESLGFGLNSMKTRAKRIGGELLIKSRVGHGTEVELRVPLRPPGGSYGRD